MRKLVGGFAKRAFFRALVQYYDTLRCQAFIGVLILEVIMEMKENDLVLPVLYVINELGSAAEKEIRDALSIVFQPGAVMKDMEMDKADRLCFQESLKRLLGDGFAEMLRDYVERKVVGRKTLYVLNGKGCMLLGKYVEEMSYLFRLECSRENRIRLTKMMAGLKSKKRKLFIYDEESLRYSVVPLIGKNLVRRRGEQLRTELIRRIRDRDNGVFCSVCGLDFEDRFGEFGEYLVELHQVEPLYQFSDEPFGEYAVEALEQIRPVCDNCHRLLHVSTIREDND